MQMIARHMPKQTIQELYEQHRNELCYYITNKVGLSPAQAEDIVHSVFEKLMRSHDGLKAVNNHRAYLYKMCMNLALDKQRRKAVRQKFSERTAPEIDDAGMHSAVDPESSADAAIQLDKIAATIQTMAAQRKNYLMMNRIDGLSCSEIARREGISEAAVRKHIVKALLECQAAVEQGRA